MGRIWIRNSCGSGINHSGSTTLDIGMNSSYTVKYCTCGEGGRAAMVRAGEGGSRPAIGEHEAPAEGSGYFGYYRFGTTMPSAAAAVVLLLLVVGTGSD